MFEKDSVLIIGAGLAGLTAADQILTKNPNSKITVLEAMKQPGGRTRSFQYNGASFDLGAQWIGGTQKFVQALALRAGLEMMEQNDEGKKIVQFGSQIEAYETDLPKCLGAIQQNHTRMIFQMLQSLAKTVPLDCPRNCPNAMEWDSMTAHSWLEQNVLFQKSKRFLQMLLRTFLGCQTNEMSFLFVLWYLHQNGGIENMMNTAGGLQAKKLVKGTQQLSFFLEKQILKKGGKIHYNTFVSKIIQTQNGVIVLTRNGQEYKASYMVLAMPPSSVRNINFSPPLSKQRNIICKKYNMGNFSKVFLFYDQRYWYNNGFSGEQLSDCHDGPACNVYDEAKPNQKGQMQYGLLVIVPASIDEQWTNCKDSFTKAVVKKLAQYYNSPELLNPIHVEMKVWTEQQSLGGAPTAFFPPGVLTKINNLRQPQGRIHWAGTETALVSQGYMDGAIQSGLRVSKQIIAKLNSNEPPKPVKIQATTKWYSQISTHKRRTWFSKL